MCKKKNLSIYKLTAVACSFKGRNRWGRCGSVDMTLRDMVCGHGGDESVVELDNVSGLFPP